MWSVWSVSLKFVETSILALQVASVRQINPVNSAAISALPNFCLLTLINYWNS